MYELVGAAYGMPAAQQYDENHHGHYDYYYYFIT